MAISFPTSPTANDTYTIANKTWKYNGYAWDLVTVDLGTFSDTSNGAYAVANAAFTVANSAYTNANATLILAQAAFDRANLSNDILFIESSYDTANAAYDKANAANVLAYNTGIGANAYTDLSTGAANDYASSVGVSANVQANVIGMFYYNLANNSAGVMANSSNGYAVSVGASGNAYVNVVGASANAWSNTKLANTDGVVFEGTLNIKNNVFICGSVTNVTQLMFNTSTNIVPATPGALTWSQDDSTLRFDMDTPSNVIQHIGQDLFYLVKNQTGSSIAKGTVVRFAGTLGASGRLLIAPAIANNSYPSKYIMGVAAATINNGDDGYVLAQGKLKQVDTSEFSAGDILYVSPSTPGAFSNTMPSAPNNKVTVAAVVHSDVNGTLQVRVTLGSKINEDELAEINGLAEGDVLAYVNANGRFENKNTLVSAYNSSNAGYVVANAAFDKANSANVLAYNTGIGANNYAGAMANAANAYAGTVGTNANTYAGVMANSSNNYAGVMANGAGTIANAAFAAANQAGVVANSANTYADSTYVKKAGDTITGDLVVQGNVTISGNTTYANTQTLLIGDAIITLNNDIPVSVAPSEDAGIEIKRGSSANVSVLWREGNDTWTLTEDGTTWYDIATNTDIAAANAYVNTSTTAANNYAGAMANSVNSAFATADSGVRAYVNTSVGAANNYAGVMANSSNGYASATYATITTVATNATAANNYAGVMANSANAYATATYATQTTVSTGLTSANNYAGTMANGAGTIANASFGLANATYAAVNSAFAVINAAYTSSNADYVLTNAAFTVANAAFTKANNTTGGATIGNTAPSTPANGALWWSNTYGRLLVYYNDGTSAQWVDASPSYDPTPIFNVSNAAFTVANAAYDQVNTLATSANSYASAVGISANAYASAVGTSTNNYTSATYSTLTQLGQNWAVTNAAFGVANSALQNTTGTFAGTLTITGSITVPSGTLGTYHSFDTNGLITRCGAGNYNIRMYPGGGTDVNTSILQFTNSAQNAQWGSLWQSNTGMGIGTDISANFYIRTGGTYRAYIDTNGHLLPYTSNTYDLGATTARWRNIYTGDLHLSNEFGDWTIVEGEDELFLYNNKKDKVYKFNLTEVDKSEAPPKKG